MTVKSIKTNPTIYRLAEQAGVSIATISRAMRNDPAVKEETRKRIQLLARQEGYHPSSIAKRLAGGRTGMFAMLMPSVYNPVYSALAKAIIMTALQEKREVLLAYSEINAQHERHILESFQEAAVDGFIIVPSFWEENYQAVLALSQPPVSKPVVVRHEVNHDCPVDAVYVDFKQAAIDATRYLIQLGHRKISYIGSNCTGGRSIGFKQALTEAGVTIASHNLVQCGILAEDAYQTARKLIKEDRPTAIVTQSDYLAMGILRAARECDLSIPRDLSIISFDNIEQAAYGFIPLTTMAQPVEELGRLLVQRLIAKINGDQSPPYRQVLSMDLIKRGSVAQAAV